MSYVMETAETGIPTEDQYMYSPFLPYGNSICSEPDKISFGENSLNFQMLFD